MGKSNWCHITNPFSKRILFFCPWANLPRFCLLVIFFGGSHGQIHGQKKGCHGQIPGKKKGFVTTAPHSFLFHRCHLLPSTPPPPSAVEPAPSVRRPPQPSAVVRSRPPPLSATAYFAFHRRPPRRHPPPAYPPPTSAAVAHPHPTNSLQR